MCPKKLRNARQPRTIPSNDPAATRAAQAYPHLVVRLMAAVYTRTAIEWTVDPLDQGFHHGNRVLRVLDPDPTAGAETHPHGAWLCATWRKTRVPAPASSCVSCSQMVAGRPPRSTTTAKSGWLAG